MSAHSRPVCPICRKPRSADSRYAPFCSKRCADVDLQRWFSGAYAIAGAEEAATPADAEADTA